MTRSTMRLTSKTVEGAAYTKAGQTIIRDTDLPGFFIVVNKKTRTYYAQVETRDNRKRETIRRALGRHEDGYTARQARAEAQEFLGAYRSGRRRPTNEITLGQAWEEFERSYLKRSKDRSEKTVVEYRYSFEKLLADWLPSSLARLSENPLQVRARFDEITKDNGPVTANRCIC